MTEKLFYKDSYQKKFTATVISCRPSGEIYEAVLDRTAFFPEGGGQYADIGTLGETQVVDVQEKDGIIYHYIQQPVMEGSVVAGEIAWDKRFSKMQQHTAEHIVSGLVHERFGYDNVGFHLADAYCTMDLNGPLTQEQLREIEFAANQALFQNVDVEIHYPSIEELADLEYRSKIEIEGQVRIVRIPGYDVCACCAPHVKKTGEIGLIKFVHCKNYKGGIRITMLSGDRAFWDYCKKDEYVKEIMHDLAAQEDAVVCSVEQLKKENADLKQKLYELQKDMLHNTVDQININEQEMCLFSENLEGSLPRDFMNMILAKGVEICAVFNEVEAQTFRYVMGSSFWDMRKLGKSMNEHFYGQGGGKANMVQGTLRGPRSKIEQRFYEEADKIRKQG